MGDENQQKIRLCVLGDGNVGKSALTIRYFQDQFVEDWDPTIEDLYVKKDAIDGQFFQLEVQDTAGQEQFALLRNDYIRHAHGFLIVFSVAQVPSTDPSKPDQKTSFQAVERYYNDIRQYHGDDTAVYIVGNKVDLKRHVDREQAQSLANRLKIGYIETSAKTKQNVMEAFQTLCKEVLKSQRESRPPSPEVKPPVQPGRPQPEDKRPKSPSGCHCVIV